MTAAIIQFRPRRSSIASTQSWGEVRDDYRLHLTVNFSKDTVRTYLSSVSGYAQWCDREGIALYLATNQDVGRWFALAVQRKKRSTAVNQMLALRHFYRWLKGLGVRIDDPTSTISATRPKIAPRQPYTAEELRALLSTARHGGYQRARPERDVALLRVLIDSGARRAEVLGLETRDIDWNLGQLLIRHGKGGKERRVALGTQTMRALRAYVGERVGPVWLNARGRKLTEPRAYELLRLIADAAGVKGATLHRFRVTAANLYMETGMALDELQRVLGHADITTTAHYAGNSATKRALSQQRRLSPVDAGSGWLTRLFKRLPRLMKLAG